MLVFTRSILENIDSITSTQEGVSHTLTSSYFSIGLYRTSTFAGCFLASLIAEGLQTGFRFTPKAIEPSFKKMNPISGIRRIVGLKALKTFLIDFLKFSAIGSVVWLTLMIFF